MQGQGEIEPDEDRLEDGVAFVGVAQFPARVKCALLGWSAFKDAALRRVLIRRTRRTRRREDHDRQHRDQTTTNPRPRPRTPYGRPIWCVDQLPDVDLTELSAAGTEEDLWEALKDVVDPELGINVVDLG